MSTDLTRLEYITERERRRVSGLLLTGDTFGLRDKIKELGGFWHDVSKGWLMPSHESMIGLGAIQCGDHYEIPKHRKVSKDHGPLFALGKIVGTPAAIAALESVAPALLGELLTRHVHGDWGDTHPGDVGLNEAALLDGNRLFSVYKVGPTTDPVTVWIITEWDRSVTTILLPEEY